MTRDSVIRVGVLHSTSGTMAHNETSLRDVVLMEIARVNASTGLLGGRIEPIVLDPASSWMAYRDMAHDMIHRHGVAAIFGCWTSVARKSVLPVVEEADSLLFYPVQYEGEELSRNIFYLGATPNQQAIPAIDFMLSAAAGGRDRFIFIGTDYVYPRTTNRILRTYLAAKGISTEDFPEIYVPFGHSDWATVIDRITYFAAGGRAAIISTINGDSNLSFYRALRDAGFGADELPVMAFSVSEAELGLLDPADALGHYACWNYFMSHPAPENAAFLETWRAYAGPGRPVFDPMEAAVIGFRMWCEAATQAGSPDTASVRQYMYGRTVASLSGGRCVMNVNHHLEKPVFVGRAGKNGEFDIVWTAPTLVAGDPWATARLIAAARVATAQRDLLDALPTPLLVLDSAGLVRHQSPSAGRQFGREMDPGLLSSIREIARASAPQIKGELPEISFSDPSGRVRRMTVTAHNMIFAGSEAVVLVFADVSYIREIEERLRTANADLERLATTDPLTGLSNRRHFLASVNEELPRARRYGRPSAMFMLDLDEFKRLNDNYGHDVGDAALIETSQQVRRILRSYDLFARYGGEEFAGFLSETDMGVAARIVERLRAGVAAVRLTVGDRSVSFTCSIGLTSVDPAQDSAEVALKRADLALYAAKAAGRNRVHLA